MGRKRKEIEPKLGRRSAGVAGPDADELARIALDLFAERHYSAVTIKDIGKAADVNSAMIYYHYQDKLALFNAAIDSAINEAFQHFDDYVHNDKHEDAVSAIKISLDCSGPEFSGARSSIKHFYSHEKKILGDIISDGIEKGIFRKIDVSVVCTMISAFLDGILARSLILKDFDMLKTVEEFKRTLWLHLGYRPMPVRTPSRSSTADRKLA